MTPKIWTKNRKNSPKMAKKKDNKSLKIAQWNLTYFGRHTPPLMKLFHLKMIFFCDRFPYGEYYLGSQKVWQVPSICGPRFDLPDLRHWRWHPGKILELCALAVCPLILTGIAAWYVVLIHFFFVLVLVLFSSKKKKKG